MPVFNHNLIGQILITLLSHCTALAQQKEWSVAALDSNKVVTEDTTSAVYYRTVEQMPDHYLVRDYRRDHTVEMRSECAAYFPDLLEEGLTTHYYQNGVKKSETHFIEGKPSGYQKTYYENGRLKDVIDYNRPKPVLLKHYDENGTAQLVPNTAFDDVGSNIRIDTLAEDLTAPICQDPDVDPSYPGGINAMTAFLSRTVKYPTFARARGVEGTLLVSFIVSQNGRLRNIEILKYLDKDLENEAVRVINAMPKWNPGACGGVPARTRYILPVKFKLTSPKPKKESNK